MKQWRYMKRNYVEMKMKKYETSIKKIIYEETTNEGKYVKDNVMKCENIWRHEIMWKLKTNNEDNNVICEEKIMRKRKTDWICK